MILDGGVQVTGLRDGEPVLDGPMRIWNHFQGDKVSLRVLELDSGARTEISNEDEEEVLYHFGDDIAFHLPAGNGLILDGKMTLVSDSGARTEISNEDEEEVLYHFGDDIAFHLPAGNG